MSSEDYKEFEKRWEKIQEEKEIESRTKIARLDKEAKLLLLKKETLAYIESFISWIDLSNEWFLKSRDLSLSEEERKLNSVIYEFYKARSDLILEELSDFLPQELQNG